jgi:hypothetical protein
VAARPDPLRVHQTLDFLQVCERVGVGREQANAVHDSGTLVGWSDLEVLDDRRVEHSGQASLWIVGEERRGTRVQLKVKGASAGGKRTEARCGKVC